MISVRSHTPPLFDSPTPSPPPTPPHVVEQQMVARAVRESLSDAARLVAIVCPNLRWVLLVGRGTPGKKC